jgi:hypothetical protein
MQTMVPGRCGSWQWPQKKFPGRRCGPDHSRGQGRLLEGASLVWVPAGAANVREQAKGPVKAARGLTAPRSVAKRSANKRDDVRKIWPTDDGADQKGAGV